MSEAEIKADNTVLTKLKAVFPDTSFKAVARDGVMVVDHNGVEMSIRGTGLPDGVYRVDTDGDGDARVFLTGQLPAAPSPRKSTPEKGARQSTPSAPLRATRM